MATFTITFKDEPDGMITMSYECKPPLPDPVVVKPGRSCGKSTSSNLPKLTAAQQIGYEVYAGLLDGYKEAEAAGDTRFKVKMEKYKAGLMEKFKE